MFTLYEFLLVIFYFIQNISNVEDLPLYNALKLYDNSNPYEQNKGFNYLKAIINNYGSIYEKNKKSIQGRIGARQEEFPDVDTQK